MSYSNPNQYMRLDCPICRGTGIGLVTSNGMCPICNGAKKISARKSCPTCLGSGVQEINGIYSLCRSCNPAQINRYPRSVPNDEKWESPPLGNPWWENR